MIGNWNDIENIALIAVYDQRKMRNESSPMAFLDYAVDRLLCDVFGRLLQKNPGEYSRIKTKFLGMNRLQLERELGDYSRLCVKN